MKWALLVGIGICFGLVRCGEETSDTGEPSGAGGGGGGAASGQGGDAGADTGAAGSSAGGGEADASVGGGEADAATDASVGGGGADAAADAAPVGAHCAPGTRYADLLAPGSILSSCGLDGIEQQLPNAYTTMVDSIALPEPVVAGALTALSMDARGSGPMNIEIWGSDSQCGVAQELLWWAPVEERILCAEFTPTAAHSHLIFAFRSVGDGTRSAQVTGVTLCPDGTCSEPPDGTGLEPGISLEAPVGAYSVSGGTLYFGYDWQVGGRGGRMLLDLDRGVDEGVPAALRGGVFRMPPSDPFGDGWYCIGADSTYTRLDSEHYAFSFHNITRFAGCDDPTGNDTVELTVAGEVGLVTSFAELGAVSLGASGGDCYGVQCSFRLTDPPQFNWLELSTVEDVGTQWEPTLETVDVREALWIMRPNDTDPFQLSCSHEGSILYDPDGTTEVRLDQMTAFEGCPGEPVEPDSFEGLLD